MERAGDPVRFLMAHCRWKVEAWAAEYGATSLRDLLSTVAAKVGLIIEYVETTDELRRLAERYVKEGEGGFACVPFELNDRTFALVVRLRTSKHGCTHVAVIDCRGPKSARRWFSTWHEIAHLLVQPQLKFDFRRTSSDEQDPVEATMDAIAGELAYLEAYYRLDVRPGEQLTLALLESHRVKAAPDASLQSAYATVVARHSTPAVFIVAAPALKAAEARATKEDALFAMSIPTPRLRAVAVVGSRSAPSVGLYIPRNIRIPEGSVIFRVYHGIHGVEPASAEETLAAWESQGRCLPPVRITVEATRVGGRAFALITPSSATMRDFEATSRLDTLSRARAPRPR